MNLQILCLLLISGAFCAGAVLIGHNGDHGNYYHDYAYEALASEYDHHVLPTVSVPIHSVSAAPYHAAPHVVSHAHPIAHHDSHSEDHDYYVSLYNIASIITYCISI